MSATLQNIITLNVCQVLTVNKVMF